VLSRVIKSLKAAEGVEILYLHVKKGFMIRLIIFDSSIDYLVFATSYYPKHNGLTVKVTHKNKGKCARMALKHLYESIKEMEICDS
jgi:hypothetical protein